MMMLAISAWAQEPSEAAQQRVAHALDAVEATEAQRQTVRDILSEQLPHLQALRTEAQALREEIRAAFTAEQIDRKEVGELRLELVDLFDRGTELGFGLMLDLSSVFTPEQRVELAELRAQRMRERAELLGR